MDKPVAHAPDSTPLTATATDDAVLEEDDLLEEDLLVEDVSIDGMCGVY